MVSPPNAEFETLVEFLEREERGGLVSVRIGMIW
jgi:hypothetical protein